MFFFLPQHAKRVLICRQPISMRLGHDRLAELCGKMGRDPKKGDVFLFFNRSKDSIKLYFQDARGDQSLTKKLDRGGFLLPAGNSHEPFSEISARRLPPSLIFSPWNCGVNGLCNGGQFFKILDGVFLGVPPRFPRSSFLQTHWRHFGTLNRLLLPFSPFRETNALAKIRR